MSSVGLFSSGQELIWLAHALEQHHIVGIDLAPGMVHVAQQKVANASLRQVPSFMLR